MQTEFLTEGKLFMSKVRIIEAHKAAFGSFAKKGKEIRDFTDPKSISELTGMVLEIQRMSTMDGPGLRTTLFLKGCSLRCMWCHNPESIEHAPQPRWTRVRCLGCGACIKACPPGALSLSPAGITIHRSLCTACGACAVACPATAMEIWGNRRPVSDVFAELIRDEPFFGEDGGITVSGGEACLQAPFVRELLGRLHRAGIGTALDTCGVCTPAQFDASCEFADLILYDLKDSDPVRHERNVGGSLERVHANFRRAVGMVDGTAVALPTDSRGDRAQAEKRPGKRLWVRTPIIPGMTDSEDNVRGIARFLVAEAMGSVERWELCAFNNLCSGKYRSLGRNWELEDSPLVSAAEMGALVGAAVAEGWPADRIRWIGMTRHES